MHDRLVEQQLIYKIYLVALNEEKEKKTLNLKILLQLRWNVDLIPVFYMWLQNGATELKQQW